eukprot:jgi/Tetstr1/436841/TSEL_025618.t1
MAGVPAGALPSRLRGVEHTLRGGPLPADGGFLTPAFSVSAVGEQLGDFKTQLDGCVNLIDEYMAASGAEPDLSVEGCELVTLQQHVRNSLRDAASEPSTSQAGSSQGGAPGVPPAANKDHVAITLANYRNKAKVERLAAVSNTPSCPQILSPLESAEEEWVAQWVAASKHLYSLQMVPHQTLHQQKVERTAMKPPASTASQDPASSFTPGPSSPAAGSSHDAGQVSPNEVVLQLVIFDPYRKDKRTHEYLVLGSSPLSEIENMVYCLNNVYMDHFKVGKPNTMLYVEGTFYNNYTGGEEGAAPRRDLSAPIREFCTQHGISAPPPDPSQPLAESERPQVRRAASGRSLADLSTQHSNAGPMYPFRTSTMQGKLFRDLWLRVGSGAGYIYCHQGCCQHAIAVADVRRVHATDPQRRDQYPFLVFQAQPLKRKCRICKHRAAMKVTTESDVSPDPVCFFCQECYLKLHFNTSGCLHDKANHLQFPYFHD